MGIGSNEGIHEGGREPEPAVEIAAPQARLKHVPRAASPQSAPPEFTVLTAPPDRVKEIDRLLNELKHPGNNEESGAASAALLTHSVSPDAAYVSITDFEEFAAANAGASFRRPPPRSMRRKRKWRYGMVAMVPPVTGRDDRQ